jgi:hypothetical protein
MDVRQQRLDAGGILGQRSGRPWSVAYLTGDETVRLEFTTDLLGTPDEVPDTDLAIPETATLDDETLTVLLHSEQTDNWYQLTQRATDRWATEVRCEVNTGRHWKQVNLEQPPVEPSDAVRAPGTVAQLPRFTIIGDDTFDPDRFEVSLP